MAKLSGTHPEPQETRGPAGAAEAESADAAGSRARGETRLCAAAGAASALCGAALMLTGPYRGAGNVDIAAFCASWLAFVCAFVSFIRPLLSSCGLTGNISSLSGALLCACAGWFAGGGGGMSAGGVRLLLFILLVFRGTLRLIDFTARRSLSPGSVTAMQAVCGAAETAAGVMLIRAVPSFTASLTFFCPGAAFVFAGAEYFCESAAIRRRAASRR